MSGRIAKRKTKRYLSDWESEQHGHLHSAPPPSPHGIRGEVDFRVIKSRIEGKKGKGLYFNRAKDNKKTNGGASGEE